MTLVPGGNSLALLMRESQKLMFYLRRSVFRQLIRVLAPDLPGCRVEECPLEELGIARLARPKEYSPNRVFGRAMIKLLKRHAAALRCLIFAQKFAAFARQANVKCFHRIQFPIILLNRKKSIQGFMSINHLQLD